MTSHISAGRACCTVTDRRTGVRPAQIYDFTLIALQNLEERINLGAMVTEEQDV